MFFLESHRQEGHLLDRAGADKRRWCKWPLVALVPTLCLMPSFMALPLLVRESFMYTHTHLDLC